MKCKSQNVRILPVNPIQGRWGSYMTPLHYFCSHFLKNDRIDLKLFPKFLFINWGHFRVMDGVIHKLLGVQHQQEVGWIEQNHNILDNENDDFIKFHKPLNMTHGYRPIFQAESKFRFFRGIRGHLEDLGPHREQHTHRVGQGAFCFLNIYI